MLYHLHVLWLQVAATLALQPAVRPTLRDYTRFHGMHIGPVAARRCVGSFADGVIVFAPSSQISDELPGVGRSRFEVETLTLLNYYALVLATLTGVSTVLGLTEIVEAKDWEHDTGAGRSEHPLDPSPTICEYLARRAGSPATPIRRFEFNFKLVALRVVMMHFRSADPERLHLVEFYEWRPQLLVVPSLLLTAALTIIGQLVR